MFKDEINSFVGSQPLGNAIKVKNVKFKTVELSLEKLLRYKYEGKYVFLQ